jgi:hypothetical protein
MPGRSIVAVCFRRQFQPEYQFAPVTVDNDVRPIMQLVGESFSGNPADDRASRRSGIEDCEFALLGGESTLHRAHDVPALSHGAQCLFRIGAKTPATEFALLCNNHCRQAL